MFLSLPSATCSAPQTSTNKLLLQLSWVNIHWLVGHQMDTGPSDCDWAPHLGARGEHVVRCFEEYKYPSTCSPGWQCKAHVCVGGGG